MSAAFFYELTISIIVTKCFQLNSDIRIHSASFGENSYLCDKQM